MYMLVTDHTPDSKVHWANMGPIWGRQDPEGPHMDPMNFVIWDTSGSSSLTSSYATLVHTIFTTEKRNNCFML